MDRELLDILACPRCRGALRLVREGEQDTGLHCPACAVLYPIREQIPVMLIEEALPWPPEGTGGGTGEGRP